MSIPHKWLQSYLVNDSTGNKLFLSLQCQFAFDFNILFFGARGAKLIMAAEDEPISDSEKVAPKTLSI